MHEALLWAEEELRASARHQHVYRRAEAQLAFATSFAPPEHDTSLYAVVPKLSHPLAKHSIRLPVLSAGPLHDTQLLPLVHDTSTVTRRSTAEVQARLICASLPLTIVLSASACSWYADWFDASRSKLSGPVVGE